MASRRQRVDEDARLDLQSLINQAYQNGRYHSIDYRATAEPPLEGRMEAGHTSCCISLTRGDERRHASFALHFRTGTHPGRHR